MKPFIHNVSFNVWQVCYVNEDNYLCAKTYKGRYAEQFAREDLERYMEMSNEQRKSKRD